MTSSRQFCTFWLDGMYFGIEAKCVQEVIRWQELTRVPLASRVVRGLMNLRGQIVAAVDLRRRLGLADQTPEKLPINIVVRCAGGPISFLVDEIGDVQEVAAETFAEPPPNLSRESRSLIRGAYKLPDRLLLVLDVEQAATIQET